MVSDLRLGVGGVLFLVFLFACDNTPLPTQTFTLTVTNAGTGTGTVTSSPTGINCGADCQEDYNSGTLVTLTATPDANSTFAGWSDACTGTGPCAVTMDAVKSVTAVFTATLNDTAPPDTTITDRPTNPSNSASASFSFTSTEAGSTFECQLDAAGYTACTSPKAYTALTTGSHTFQVRAKDAAGNTDATPASYTWTIDTTAPTVSSISPAIGATGVAVNSTITAIFSETMDGTTFTPATFTLTITSTGGSVAGTVTYAGGTATFTPSANLASSTGYTATITAGVKDSAGNAMASNYTWTFTTGSASAINLPETGQTTSYATGDDGNLQKGVAWPNPRFTVGTGAEVDCVTDNLTGLMWVKTPDSTTRTWQDALTYANDLSLCGYTDWRLPNVNELESLTNAEQPNTATWLNIQGFSNVQANLYWSSSTITDHGWIVVMFDGSVYSGYKAFTPPYTYVWPVRAGQ